MKSSATLFRLWMNSDSPVQGNHSNSRSGRARASSNGFCCHAFQACQRLIPRLAVTFQNLKTDEILKQLVDGVLDLGVVSRFEAQRVLVSAPLGKLEFRLFAPATLLPANERLKLSSEILGQMPLAMLDGSAGIRQAIEQEAQRVGAKLNVRLRFSSYPQLAQAVASLEVAAILPQLAESAFEGKAVRTVSLSFLSQLSRQVCLVWNRRVAEVRPAIAKYSRLLPSIFRMSAR